MSANNAVLAMNVHAAHNKEHRGVPMKNSTETCRKADRILEDNNEAKKTGLASRCQG